MVNCSHGQTSPLARTQVVERIEAAGHVFSAEVDALKCTACGELHVDGPSLERAELAAAKMLADAGEASGASLRFMRKALGLQAQELAELLGVSVETMSKWERGHRDVDTHAWLVVAALVSDRIEGRTTTRDRLEATRKRSRLPKQVRVEVPATGVTAEAVVAERLTKIIRRQDYVTQMMFANTPAAKEDLRDRIRSGYVSELDPAGTGTLTRKKNVVDPTRPTTEDMRAVRGLLTRIETALVRDRWDVIDKIADQAARIGLPKGSEPIDCILDAGAFAAALTRPLRLEPAEDLKAKSGLFAHRIELRTGKTCKPEEATAIMREWPTTRWKPDDSGPAPAFALARRLGSKADPGTMNRMASRKRVERRAARSA